MELFPVGILVMLICLLLPIVVPVYGWSCPPGIQNVYKKVQDEADLVFQANISSSGAVVLYSIRFLSETPMYTVNYYNNNQAGTPTVNGCTFIGDTSTGNLTIRIGHLTETNAGVYRLQRVSSGQTTVTACVTLFLLGKPTIPTIVSDKNPEVGESVSLTCSSKSTTTPSNHSLSLEYKWMLNGTSLPSDSKYTVSGNKLTVSGVTSIDSLNRFTCTAREVITNGYTSDTRSNFMINVLYGPLNIKFTPSKDLYEEPEDTSISQVTCSADCNTGCTYRWDKVSPTTALVTHSALLNLGILQRAEAGIYRCTATRDGSNILTKDLTVNVKYGPDNMSFNPSTTSYRQNEGSTLSPITCSAQCWNCTYEWTSPNSFISSGPVLRLSTLTRSEDGKYTCTARNTKSAPQAQQTKSLVLKVRYGPDALSLTPAKTEYTQNENTVLADITCDAACYPACTYTWTNLQTNAVVSRTGVLSLGTFDKNKAATYKCTAFNPEKSGTVSKQVKLLVRYGPDKISLTPAKTEYTQNENTVLADLTCDAACYPTCTYTWTNLQTNTVVSGTGVLSLGTLDKNKAATYQCTATNPEKSGTVSTQVKMLVRYGPDKCNTNVSSTHTLTEGDNPVSITCTSDCYPSCSYQWRNVTDDKVIKQDGNMELGTISRHEAGSYKCMCQNDAQEYRKSKDTTIQLIVKCNPLEPTNFKYLPAHSPTFTWNGNFNCGNDQIFVLETSKDSTTEWIQQKVIHEGDKQYLKDNETYVLSLTGLRQGVYNVRLIAESQIGRSEPVYLCAPFYVGEAKAISTSKPNTAAIVTGVVLGSVVVVLAGYGTYVTVLNRRLLNSKGKTDQLYHDKEESSTYVNLAVKNANNDASTIVDDNSSSQYMSLQTSSADDTSTYDTIMRQNI